MTAYAKTHTPYKTIKVRSPELEAIVLKTMERISAIVGATLGPGGSAVLIDRQDFGLPPLVTKDGVTVFQNLGFRDPMEHCIMESARDAAARTVSEAGDGTTTATVLAYALVRYAQEYHRDHPEVPAQHIVERLRDVFEEKLVPLIDKFSREVEFDTEEGKRLLHAVATISANGDAKLADAVMECFEVVGDQGTVTLSERSGPPGYVVEKLEGYPVPVGYEDSCAKFLGVFMNDPANSRCFLAKPYFILWNGVVADVQALYGLLDRMQHAWLNRPGPDHVEGQPFLTSPNIVVVAHGFSEQVLGTLALNFKEPNTINVVPLVTPRSPLQNGEAHFLDDLAAITGSTVLDPLSKSFDQAEVPNSFNDAGANLSDIGQVQEFEMLRFRSTIVGHADEDLIVERANVLEGMVASAISELDARLLRERMGALTGGIAKLWVVGSSQGELRERRDRADDAVRAVQGAIKYGVLPGGGWALLRLARALDLLYGVKDTESAVLARALREPVRLLLTNTGLDEEKTMNVMTFMEGQKGNGKQVWDAAKRNWVNAFKGGILDSVPAVREAIRNSISAASLLGTLGGIIAYPRDEELERREASDTQKWLRDVNEGNPANDRP